MLRRATSFNFPSNANDYGFTLVTTVGDPVSIAGRFGGRAVSFRNTAFGAQDLVQAIDLSHRVWFGFAYRQVKDGSGIWAGLVDVVRATDGTSTLLQMTTRADLRLDITLNGITKPTATVFTASTWFYVEFVYNDDGSGELWVNDALDVQFTASGGAPFPTSVAIRWQNRGDMGVDFDDWVFGDETGSTNTTRIGPVKIGSWYPASDEVVGLTRNGGSSNAGRVSDRFPATAPDNLTSYVSAAAAGALDLYVLHPEDSCSALILAVTANMFAMAPGGSGFLAMVVRPDGTSADTFDIGAIAALTSAWQYFQAIVLTNPKTGEIWNDGMVEQALWGLQTASSDAADCTMFWVEKVQTLRNVPFGCGGLGSYVVSRS